MSHPSTVEVAVPLPLRQTFHYRVPDELSERAAPGQRVQVRFGPRKIVGYVVATDTPPPPDVKLAPVVDFPDARPIFEPPLLKFLRWLADYYHAPLGEVLRGAHPAGMNASDQPGLAITEAGRAEAQAHPALAALCEASPQAIGRLPERPTAKQIRRWIEAGWVTRRRVEKAAKVRVRMARAYRSLAPPPAISNAPARDAVHTWLHGRGAVTRQEILAEFPRAAGALTALVKLGRIEKTDLPVERDPFVDQPVRPDRPPPLTAAQAEAVAQITSHQGFAGFLLQGITGSGKTEVYLQVIAAQLARGRGALVLVPEIALTPQAVERFRARLGDVVAVLHSGLSPGARFDQWRRLRAGELQVAIGARSALFAPVPNLGVIVIDEEHDPSFKQHDGVRYHARDMALVRGAQAGATVVLGSATPSLESTYNVERRKLKRLVLPHRATGGSLPRVHFIDLRKQRAPNDDAPFLSTPLRQALQETLARGEQAILFLNRRGFSNFVRCTRCAHVVECANCAIAMTWHQGRRRLACHYCDASRPWPERCPACELNAMALPGRGTERLEGALARLFPNARVARMDRDTAAGRKSADILAEVGAGRVDILVGTQMVTKGHDFPNVTLVGVIDADGALKLPDFRAAERVFQRLTQVAGRAGRGDQPGRVLIQTWDPDDATLRAVGQHDHAALCAAELPLRDLQGYPPFAHAVALRVDGREGDQVEAVAGQLGAFVRRLPAAQAVRVRGPAVAAIERIRGRTRWQLLLTSPRREALHAVVRAVLASDAANASEPRVSVDVDPYDFL